jgi:NAD(P)-dependent dehydrogenase (short-subunit alcohol dehydrogenase family)
MARPWLSPRMNLPSRQSRKPFAERAGGQASSIVADVTDIADVTEIFDLAERDSGRVDMAVQNAGVITIARIDDLPEEDWDKVKAVSTKGCSFAVRWQSRAFASTATAAA